MASEKKRQEERKKGVSKEQVTEDKGKGVGR